MRIDGSWALNFLRSVALCSTHMISPCSPLVYISMCIERRFQMPTDFAQGYTAIDSRAISLNKLGRYVRMIHNPRRCKGTLIKIRHFLEYCEPMIIFRNLPSSWCLISQRHSFLLLAEEGSCIALSSQCYITACRRVSSGTLHDWSISNLDLNNSRVHCSWRCACTGSRLTREYSCARSLSRWSLTI